jgi:hypothetical protein
VAAVVGGLLALLALAIALYALFLHQKKGYEWEKY